MLAHLRTDGFEPFRRRTVLGFHLSQTRSGRIVGLTSQLPSFARIALAITGAVEARSFQFERHFECGFLAKERQHLRKAGGSIINGSLQPVLLQEGRLQAAVGVRELLGGNITPAR